MFYLNWSLIFKAIFIKWSNPQSCVIIYGNKVSKSELNILKDKIVNTKPLEQTKQANFQRNASKSLIILIYNLFYSILR